jgi:hypothetical protein
MGRHTKLAALQSAIARNSLRFNRLSFRPKRSEVEKPAVASRSSSGKCGTGTPPEGLAPAAQKISARELNQERLTFDILDKWPTKVTIGSSLSGLPSAARQAIRQHSPELFSLGFADN